MSLSWIVLFNVCATFGLVDVFSNVFSFRFVVGLGCWYVLCAGWLVFRCYGGFMICY